LEGSESGPGSSEPVVLIPFDNEDAARAALLSGDIQAYYVVSQDYASTNRVDLVYVEPPSDNAASQFWDFMQINRLADLPPEVAQRAVSGSNVIARWPEDMLGGRREFDDRLIFGTFTPALVGVAFIMLLLMISSYLMSAVAEEKENRTMEIVVTSISPNQLIGGKVLGICAIALTQVLAWSILIGLVIEVGGRQLNISVLQRMTLDLRLSAELAIIGIPTLVMFAALMVALGATATETHEAQQVTSLLALPMWVPYWLAIIIIQDANGPLATGLSFFPLTALSTLSLRIVFAPVPFWQIAASVLIQTVCAIGAVWLAARTFRLGMLRYGQRLSWRELFVVGKRHAAPLA
jgi:ABC-2 type transport system permease protein